jgi:uncharacterized protein YjbI with pentapeptide repeats
MADEEQIRILKQGSDAWNDWREQAGDISVDLSRANLVAADLSGTDLSGASLNDANLGGADLSGTELGDASLNGANLYRADLSGTDLSGATLNGGQPLQGQPQRDRAWRRHPQRGQP